MHRLVPSRCSLPQGACLQSLQNRHLHFTHYTNTQEHKSWRGIQNEFICARNPCPKLGTSISFVASPASWAESISWGLRTLITHMQTQDIHLKSHLEQFDLYFRMGFQGYQSKAVKKIETLLDWNTGKPAKNSDLYLWPSLITLFEMFHQDVAQLLFVTPLCCPTGCSETDPVASCYQRWSLICTFRTVAGSTFLAKQRRFLDLV